MRRPPVAESSESAPHTVLGGQLGAAPAECVLLSCELAVARRATDVSAEAAAGERRRPRQSKSSSDMSSLLQTGWTQIPSIIRPQRGPDCRTSRRTRRRLPPAGVTALPTTKTSAGEAHRGRMPSIAITPRSAAR